MSNGNPPPSPAAGITMILVGLVALSALGVALWTKFDTQQPAAATASPTSDKAAPVTELPPIRPRTVTPRGELAPAEKSTIALFQKASPAVVHITSLRVQRLPFSMDVTKQPAGTGTGFMWDDSGHIVTNFHVISEAQGARVALSDNTTVDAELVGVAPDKDLAVLRIKVPKAKLKPLAIGTSKDLQVGQSVFAIGNPFGFDQTLTTGVISGLGREIDAMTRRKIKGVVQTDAAINPGNSGGPLLDSAGRLIGVNTAIYSPSGAYAGIGFAVPVDTVARIVPQLIANGRIIRPGLGVGVLPDAQAARYGIQGVMLLDVPPTSSAGRAGLRGAYRRRDGSVAMGDVIIAVDGKKVASGEDLYDAFDGKKVGDQVKVTTLRGREQRDATVTLQALE